MNGATAVISYGALGTPAVTSEAPPNPWIDTIGLSKLAGISRQAAHAALTKCHNGELWREVNLEVRPAANGRGLECCVPSLPRQLHDIWKTQNPSILESPQAPAAEFSTPARFDPDIGSRIAVVRWKMSIIAPALAFPKRSRQRAETLQEIAAQEHKTPNGTPVTYSVDTLRDWCETVAIIGDHGLARRRRADDRRNGHARLVYVDEPPASILRRLKQGE